MVLRRLSVRVAQARYTKGGRLTPWAQAPVPAPLPLAGSRDAIVPLVSSGVAGPIGLVHLPRMWLDGVLAAHGRLDPRFAAGEPLFDDLVCAGIGIERDALRDRLRAKRPAYPEFEAWVCERATRLDGASIAQVNNAIAKAGIASGEPIVQRNDLRAWRTVHERVIAGAQPDPIVPAISSRTAGPLGVDHLPRLWLKSVLKVRGALPLGYRAARVRLVARGLAGVPGGLDAATYAAIGLDMDASAAFVERELPDYPAFEAWVRAHARSLDPASVARHNATCDPTRDGKAQAEKTYAGWHGVSDWSYLLDDLIDWKLLHQVVSGEPLPDWTA